MLNFIILAGGLTLILYKPVCRFLKERRDHYEKIEEDNAKRLEECERLKEEYETKLRDADEALAERQRVAEREMAENASRFIEGAKLKADSIVKEAEEEAEARKAHILESAQTEIGELVLSAAQKLMGDSVTPESDAALYDEFIRTANAAEDLKGNKDE